MNRKLLLQVTVCAIAFSTGMSFASADTGKMLNADVLIIDAQIKALASHCESIDLSLLEAQEDAMSPAAKDKTRQAAISEKISELTEDKKATESKIREAVARYNALLGDEKS